MKNRAFARYTKKGQLVPGSLVVTTKGGYPNKTSLWKEVPVSLFDESPYGKWSLVTGGIAGDGVVLVNGSNRTNPNRFTIVGPDDSEDEGWVYLKRQFSEGAILSINYNWTSFDDGIDVDWPIYWISSTEPTGEPNNTESRVEDTPANGVWTVVVPPGHWFSVGIYSSDSCCGRGFLDINVSISTSKLVEYEMPSSFSINNPFAVG